MSRRALVRVLAFVALVVAGATFVFAAPAQAAPKPIGLSTDGVTYTDSLSTSLFAGALIVPGKTVTRSFWVKNRAADPGNLAVALQDVTGTDGVFLTALSLQATGGAAVGPTVAFTSAAPCRSLISGIALASNATVRVDVTIALSSSLSNVTSQSSIGGFKLPVTLTSTDVAAPTACSAVTPPIGGGTGGGGGGGTSGGGTHNGSTPGQIDSSVISGAAGGTVPGDGSTLPDSSGTGAGASTDVIPNTGRFFQELDVLGWLAALTLGGIVAWRRSRREPEETYR
ncbi:MAG: hypothetical protein ABI566_11445 [Pseudolysinimonas sp.]